MNYILGGFIFSFLISKMILPHILIISHKKNLYDIPDERKHHKSPVPRLGGFLFFPVILITILSCIVYSSLTGVSNVFISNDELHTQFCTLSIGGMCLFLVGVKDDLIGVDYKSKFVAQIFSAGLLALSGLWINSLGGISFFQDIPIWIGFPFSVFLCVYITNAINLIDGIDGLASGLAIISLITMGILFVVGNQMMYAMLAFSSVGCILPFFWTNVRRSAESRKKLFMGDTGSLSLGYLISFLFLSLSINSSSFNPIESRFQYIAFGSLIIPTFDVVRVVLLRLRQGKAPFLPDRNHIHHKLLRAGMSGTQVMLFLLAFSFFFIICNYVLTAYIYGYIVFLVDLGIWLLFHGVLNIIIHKRIQEKSGISTKISFGLILSKLL